MNTINQEQIICPYCGWKDPESYEYESECGEVHCPNCNEVFYYSTFTYMLYSTAKDIKEILKI